MHLTLRTAVAQPPAQVMAGFTQALFEALAPPFPRLRVLRFDDCRPGNHVDIELDTLLTRLSWTALIVEASGRPDGQLDGDFDFTQGPTGGEVQALAVQPDGAILVGGTFRRVGGQLRPGLVRLLGPSVLSVAGSKAPTRTPARTIAYPVPAHGQLRLRLDATHRPQRVQLLDALGRTVRTQPVTRPELTLDTNDLPLGVYLLRAEYAGGGPVTQRVVLE